MPETAETRQLTSCEPCKCSGQGFTLCNVVSDPWFVSRKKKKKKSSRFAFSKMSTLLENSLSKKERRALLLMGSQILEGIGYSRFLKLAPGLHQETLAKSADKCGCHNWGRGFGPWKERQGVGFLLPCQSLCDSVSALIQRKWVGSPKLGRSRSFQKEP